MEKNYPEVAEASEPMVTTTRVTGSDVQVGQPPLDTKDTGGVMGQPTYAVKQASKMMQAPLNYDGGINQSASGENLSAKFKNPNVKESVSPKGNNQYE